MPNNKQLPYIHTIDVVVCRYNKAKQSIEVLLNERKHDPYKGLSALPGLVVNGEVRDDTLDDAVSRLMRSERVGYPVLHIEQVGTEGNGARDPRCWSSSTYYMAFIGDDQQLSPSHRFENLDLLANGDVNLPFDHNLLCAKVRERLISKSLYSNLPILLLGEQVTLFDAVQVASCIMGRAVQKSSMSRRIARLVMQGVLETRDEKVQIGMGPPQKVLINVMPHEVVYFDKSLER